jgi:hypothetical protein
MESVRLPKFTSGRRDIRPFGPTPTQSRIPLRGLMKLRFARDIGPRTPTPGPFMLPLRLGGEFAYARGIVG